MTQGFLTPEQREQLEQILRADLPERWGRYARLILLYDEGQATHQIAPSVGLSRSRVRYWRRQFLARGMATFPGYSQTLASGTEEEPAALKEPDRAAKSQPSEGKRAKKSHRSGAERPAEESLEPDPLQLFVTAAQKISTPGVLPEDTLAEAGRKVLRYHFGQMLLHEDGTRLGEDIEELHDMRVATRRMRAAVEVFAGAFEPKAIKVHLKGLRQTGRALGRVRDLDVLLEKAAKYLSTQPAEFNPGLQPLLSAWKQQRQASREGMLAYLESDKYRTFKLKFHDFTHSPGAGVRPTAKNGPTPLLVQEVAPMLIYTRLGAVRAYDACLENASIEQLHALRIEFKKLRYTVEFFREVLGDTAKAVINDIKKLQDHLGDLNDAQVATELLRDFLAQWDIQQTSEPIQERQSPQPVMAYLAYQYEQRHQLMRTFRDTWAYFIRPEFRHNLALAVSVL
ncbi:MAG TPA: CHAD domain-containing protein [Anaerolineales bacterium]|nr:CHAD domain-containing protein [Anaerolineales bacterium]